MLKGIFLSLVILFILMIPGINILFIVLCIGMIIDKKFLKLRTIYKGSGELKGIKINKGEYGEKLILRKLEGLEGSKRIITNIYLPKEEGTTEVDLIMIHPTGLYVIESKNYKGWIFGQESDKMWSQCLVSGVKTKFYNPIRQNKTHIKALNQFTQGKYAKYIYSYVVFGIECEFKKVTWNSPQVSVCKIENFLKTLEEDITSRYPVLSEEEIVFLESQLKRFTDVDEEFKKKHIEFVKKSLDA